MPIEYRIVKKDQEAGYQVQKWAGLEWVYEEWTLTYLGARWRVRRLLKKKPDKVVWQS